MARLLLGLGVLTILVALGIGALAGISGYHFAKGVSEVYETEADFRAAGVMSGFIFGVVPALVGAALVWRAARTAVRPRRID